MSFAQPAKENTLMLKLVEELKERLPAYNYTQSFDANGYPTLLMSQSLPAVSQQNNAFIVFLPVPTPFVDSINTPQGVWTPLICNVVEEALTGSPTISCVAQSISAQINQCVINQGCINNWYLSAAGTLPSEAAILPANLQTSSVVDAYLPLSGQ